jgi:phenylalanyl-tRNA synthetase beta chain
MKISLNWLKDYLSFDLEPQELNQILTDTGLEVEGIEKIEAVTGGMQGVVIGEVLTCEQHPDADRLRVTTVNLGQGEPVQIVCGAPNVAAGQKVVVATSGCTLYPKPDEPFKIKPSKIRGVESNGMICAEDELGIGESHAGIMVLDASAVPGTPAADYFNLQDDYLIEIGLTPNRADAMGHIGVARDLKAFLNVHQGSNLEIQFPDVSEFSVASESHPVKIEVQDTERCPRYCGVTLAGVEVKPSPEWLQQRLRTIGLTPINNVVDVTNYVMHELATPLHAFDAEAVNGRVFVRTAKEGEVLVTLDEVERKLSSTDLVIANADRAMCIAGVFGGADSGVSEDTNVIFLESAVFNPVSVRKTARSQGLNTDASFRFERGVDPELTMYALKRAALLIQQVAGGEIAMTPVDVYPQTLPPFEVKFSPMRCNALIGTTLSDEQIRTILTNLDIQVLHADSAEWTLTVPAYRVDVQREADVVEEVLRIYGFNNVPLPEKLNTSLSFRQKPDKEALKNTVADLLVGNGAFELLNNSLTKSAYVNDLGGEVLSAERNVQMLNPLSNELDVMRQSLLFSALEVVEYNQNRQRGDIKAFEFGKVYHKFDSGYHENERLLIVFAGKREKENWNAVAGNVSFYTLKGMVNALFRRLGLDRHTSEKALKNSLLEDGVQLVTGKTKAGEMGWISAKTKKYFGLKTDVFVADLDWDAMVQSSVMNKVKFTELPKTQLVRRDFSLLLDNRVTFGEIQELARKVDKKILREVGLFDVYEGKNLEEGKKSYAVSFYFRDDEKTLKDEQVDAVMNRIRESLENELNAQLRG